MNKQFRIKAKACMTVLASILLASAAGASSHMDAPRITLDDAANTTDVYAFVSEQGGQKYLTTALAVYPFEEPGIGPNAYNFDPNVLYEIHVAVGDDVSEGRATFSYQFEFDTRYNNQDTILQSYVGVVGDLVDPSRPTRGFEGQNLVQTYEVRRVDHRRRRPRARLLGRGVVPPNNQGIVTPFYNQNDDGEMPAKEGIAPGETLDLYTERSIAELREGYIAFAGQRDDGFYADIQAVFDLLNLRTEGRFDSQGGFNLHTMVLNIPIEKIGGEDQVVGVYATTSRRRVSVLRSPFAPRDKGKFVQVARQGNPLFCEALVAVADKDRYNRTSPAVDRSLFKRYAESPELARLLGANVQTDRSDLVGIFIPDLIKVDLSTGPARLAGREGSSNPNEAGFHRLGIFGDTPDVLFSQVQEGFGGGVVPGGWPNGRRFGDDVLDIAVTAVLSDLRDPLDLDGKLVIADGVDRVDGTEIAFNRVFPYAATPHNGRNHPHHQEGGGEDSN